MAVSPRDLPGVAAALGEQHQTGVHRAFGVIFTRGVGAEHGKQVVARVLQHLAVVLLDHGGASCEQTVDGGVRVFGVEALCERRGADNVEEQDRHLAKRLIGCRCVRKRSELGAQRRDCGLGQLVAEQFALRLQRGAATTYPYGKA